MTHPDQTINVPQLIIVILLGGLALRYFFFSPSSSSATTNTRSVANARAREQDVETIQQMFPQVSRRSIMWDLQRNGGSVAATTERILSGRGLENPPQSFQPLPPPTQIPSSSSSSTSTSTGSKSLLPDLITRYNLQSKLAAQPEEQRQEEPEVGKKKQGQAWSQNKGERQALLQKRREEMILGARKKMEEKLAREKEAAANAAVGGGTTS